MTKARPRPRRTPGSVDPRNLVEARLQLHWAVQLASAFAQAALERLPDDSQSNLGWRDDLDTLEARQRPDGLVAGLRLTSLELLIFDRAGASVDGLALDGKTLDEGLAWLGGVAAQGHGDSTITLRDYDMPPHSTASGKPFALHDPAAFAELAVWFATGNAALESLTSFQPGWTEVRCWPHHFDLGTVVSLESTGDPSSGRSIGAGMSPGDSSYAEPYFYVNPYGLQSKPGVLPRLPVPAGWHTDGWFGAVLRGSALVTQSDPSSCIADFLDAASAAARELLEP